MRLIGALHCGIVGMRDVFFRLLRVRALVVCVLVMVVGDAFFRCSSHRSFNDSRYRRLGAGFLRRRRGDGLVMGLVVIMLVVVMIVVTMVIMPVIAMIVGVRRMTLVVMMHRGLVPAVLMLGMLMIAVRVVLAILRMVVAGEGSSLRRLGMLDDPALDAVVVAAAARRAMARTAPVGTVFVLFLGFAMGALVGRDQGLSVGDRDLVIVGMDFAEGEEAVAVAAIFDKGGLQRWLYPRDLGEVDIAAQLLALGGLEVKFFDAIAADHDDPGFFRMGRIDQHLVGHFGTLDGGGRVEPGAR
jgi:hypothetical protein